MTAMIEVSDLHVAYRHVEAVRGVSLRVDEGEIVTVLGLNGAGKTTLLQAIVGRVRPKRGRITFLGEDITRASMTSIARRGIALVPEGRHIFPRMTVAKNLRLAATTDRGRPDAAAKLASALDRYPALTSLMDRPAGLLSGGEQQQLAIARALLTDPRLLILDEADRAAVPADELPVQVRASITRTDELFEAVRAAVAAGELPAEVLDGATSPFGHPTARDFWDEYALRRWLARRGYDVKGRTAGDRGIG